MAMETLVVTLMTRMLGIEDMLEDCNWALWDRVPP